MKVTKEVTFDSAHMLSNYQGKCHNLHGHTYKVQVTLDGAIHEVGNEQGMVMDFSALNSCIDSVLNCFDHAIIFSSCNYRSEAEEALLRWAEEYGMNFVVIDGKSTSETIATYIKKKMEEYIPTYTVSVRLWETPTSFAEV